MSLAEPVSEPPNVSAARLLDRIQARFADGLQMARTARAAGPHPDAEAMRRAYLDLLKLSLCDLVGGRTTSVIRTFQGEVMSRELEGDLLRFRSAGMDWPLHGLTMVGLARLDDVQACVESLVADGVDGDLIEAGTWRGGAAMLMRATLDSLGDDAREVWLADSFQGFPAVEREDEGTYDLDADLARCDYLAVPVEEVEQSFARLGLDHGLRFVPGFFEDTLPRLADRRWALVRLDGDTYDATLFSLEMLYPSLSAGGYLIIDDYFQLEPCRAAVDDFRQRSGITEPIEQIDWSGARWRRASEPSPRPAPAAAPGEAERVPRTMERTHQRVPAIEEVELAHELAETRRRLAAAEREVKRLTSSPLTGPAAWLRRVLRRLRRGWA
jgi:hypothetical protein